MCKYTFFILLFFVLLFFIIDSNSTKESFIQQNNSNALHHAHPIQIYDNFITSEQCDFLINIVQDRFKDSTVYATSSGTVDKKSRSSTNAYFGRKENALIDYIESKVANMLNIDRNQIEPLQIVKYTKGQEYKLHYDYFDANADQYKNQRTNSILIYLNDLDIVDGGATFFPLYKMRFYPYKTRAIKWENINCDQELNTLSLHCGEPIESDKIKYVLTIWTREYPY